MSIAELCDHRGIVYRPRPDTDDTTRDELGGVAALFDPLLAPDGLNCRPNQNWSGTLQDHGPGEQQNAQRTWYLVPEFDVKERDVLEIVAGPNAGLTLRVMSVTPCTAPIEVHHIEVNVEVDKVDLHPEDEES